MKTLVFGATGYFGRLMLETLSDAVPGDADIADPMAVAVELDRHQPEIVVNCAGKTGRPNVDWCETHREETLRSNITGPLVLHDACHSRGVYWVHLSSGCLYQGDNGGKGFRETDRPNFHGSYYSRSKGYADQILSEFPVLVLRPRMPFDGSLHGRSLFGKLIHYSRVVDAQNSFTYVPDFLTIAERLIADRRTGVFNVVNPGVSSPYALMSLYRDRIDSNHVFERLSVEQLSELTRAGRSNCVLSTRKLADLGLEPRSLEDAIDDALTTIAANNGP